MSLNSDIILSIGLQCDMDTVIALSCVDYERYRLFSNYNMLASRYGLPIVSSFSELVKRYDMRYLTKRCERYWPLEDCLLWYLQNNLDHLSLLSKYPNIRVDYNRSLVWACENYRYDVIDFIFDKLCQDLGTLTVTIHSEHLDIMLPFKVASTDIVLAKYLEKCIDALSLNEMFQLRGSCCDLDCYWTSKIIYPIYKDGIIETWLDPYIIGHCHVDVFNWIKDKCSANERLLRICNKSVARTGRIEFIDDPKDITLEDICSSGNKEAIEWYLMQNGLSSNILLNTDCINSIVNSGLSDTVWLDNLGDWVSLIDIVSFISPSEYVNIELYKEVFSRLNLPRSIRELNRLYPYSTRYILTYNRTSIIKWLNESGEQLGLDLGIDLDSISSVTFFYPLNVNTLKWLGETFHEGYFWWGCILTNNFNRADPETLEYIITFGTYKELDQSTINSLKHLLNYDNRRSWLSPMLLPILNRIS